MKPKFKKVDVAFLVFVIGAVIAVYVAMTIVPMLMHTTWR